MSQNKTVNKKLISIGTAIGIFAAAILIAYAVGSVVFKKSFVVEPTYTYSYDIDLADTTVAVGDLLPGDSFTVSPTITSKSTGNAYVFLRIECNTVDDGTEGGKLIYDFTDNNDEWTVVKRDGADGYLLVVYGDLSTCTPFAPGAEIDVNGKLTLDIDYAQYATLAEVTDPLKFTVHVCGIHSEKVGDAEAPTGVPLDIYQQYVNEGGE